MSRQLTREQQALPASVRVWSRSWRSEPRRGIPAAMFAAAEIVPRTRVLRGLDLQAAAFTAAELEQEARDAHDVIEAHHHAQGLHALRAAVEELEPPDRAVYVALYREERQVNEIAEALAVDRRTISRVLERIREHLAARLRPLVA